MHARAPTPQTQVQAGVTLLLGLDGILVWYGQGMID